MMTVVDKGKEVCVVLNENDFIKIMTSKESSNILLIENKNGVLSVSTIVDKQEKKK